MSKRRECAENYKVTTVINQDVENWVEEVISTKEFYDFAATLMYKYKKHKVKQVYLFFPWYTCAYIQT
ncbi:hypothetical protein CXF51_11055 [Bacillus subtilis subsp. subtilis]|nr:hypothetical protein CXF51_11055 [Bacillus subtilis subsp. subtilis]